VKFLLAIGLSGFFTLLGIQRAEACSVAFYTGGISGGQRLVSGRTMDLDDSFGDIYPSMLAVHPREVSRDGNRKDGSLVSPIQWVSKYGSVVLGESDGVNEKGVCVHLLYLAKTAYPEPADGKSSLSCLKVLQYLLDNAASVDECLALIDSVLIVGENVEFLGGREAPVHFAIRDANNDSAIVEFINAGSARKIKPVVSIHHGKEFDVMTNEPYYDVQLKKFKRYSMGRRALPGDFNALDRFTRLKMFKKTLLAGADDWSTVCNVFSLMATVHCMPVVIDYSRKESNEHPQWPTYWTTVIDVDNLCFYLKLTKYPNMIWLDLKGIDFDTLKQTGSLDPRDHSLLGEVIGHMVWQ